MTNKLSKQNRIDFQYHLAELIGADAGLSNHPRIKSSALYRALLADLETIAEAARRLFPAVEPPDRVWEHIELAVKRNKRNKG